METEFSIISFFTLTLIILGLTTGIILWNFPKEKNISNRILSIAIFTLMWAISVAFLVQTRLILYVPHLYRTGNLASLIFIPFPYLYVRSISTRTGLVPRDLLHALPTLFFLVDYFPFFMLGSEEKINIISQDISGYYKMNDYDEGWITPPHFHYIFRHILTFVYWLLQARVLYLIFFRKMHFRAKNAAKLKSWLFIFTGVQLFGFVPLVVRHSDDKFQWLIVFACLAFPIAFTALWLFLRPEILYGITVRKNEEVEFPGELSSQNAVNGHHPSFHDKELSAALHKHMVEHQKFLQHKYSIHDLANDLKTPPHQISYLLNQHLNMSFHDFLNKYRVEYCIERMKKGDAQRFTLEALSFECGFNNRNSFTAAFKRFTGITPSDFMKSTKYKVQ